MSRPKNPYRLSAVSQSTGLTVIVSAMSDDYHSSVYSGYGVRVIIFFKAITFSPSQAN